MYSIQDSPSEVMQHLRLAKAIAIVGFGREGQSTYRFIRKMFPSVPLGIYDEHFSIPNAVEQILLQDLNMIKHEGKLSALHFGTEDVLFKTPGISMSQLHFHEHAKQTTYVTSQTDLFTQLFRDQIIAVTGTKGKSTTSHALTTVFSIQKHKVLFVGNIGKPALDFVDDIDEDTTIIYEMSSHQAESLHVSPHIAVIMNIYQDHLDYYGFMDAYVTAKTNIALFQNEDDLFVYNKDFEQLGEVAKKSPAKKLVFSETDQQSDAYIDENQIYIREEGQSIVITHANRLQLPGTHNLLNVIPSLLIGRYFGFSIPHLQQAVEQITPLAGRLELVAKKNGISFYDDAVATIPEATIAALHALPKVTTLIAGGFDRGQDFGALAVEIIKVDVRNLIIFPTTGKRIVQALESIGSDITVHMADSMQQAVQLAYACSQSGDIVLLSTASPSFGLFTDYQDRSNQYLQWIDTLA